MVRRLLRHTALDALSLLPSERALERPRVQIVFLHHVLPEEERPFRALLERVLRQHTFLSYSDAVARIASGEIDRPYLSVTFDDGVRNQLRAAEILRDYGISACFFVCAAMADAQFLTWSDMEQLLAAGHEIGNHTSHHKTLAGLDAGELAEEIGGSLASLRRCLGDSIKHFAWPRGRFHEFSAAAAAEVFRAGHVSCASGVRGCHVAGPPRALRDVCIRRDHVVAADPLRHTLYFLANNSRRATDTARDWPQW